ncbi:MAG: GNAT family N-acetyltransferase [Geminicoccaceae bacterium]
MDASDITIRDGDLDDPLVHDLLKKHLLHATTHSPLCSVHALDLDGLRQPNITFWTIWENTTLVGFGALKELDPLHGEIKSMHTAEAFRGRGLAAKLLGHIIDVASARRYRRISLETGTMAGFAPARALYARFGFENCEPFANYFPDPNSQCMTLVLERPTT